MDTRDGKLKDVFGRTARRLRLSVTDHCNFRCVYCMPADVHFMDRAEILTYDELLRLARIAVSLGIEKIRVTGGEPLVRSGVPEFIQSLARLPELRSISMTTNGVLLREQAQKLRAAGLKSVNISLDSLRRDRFEKLCRRDALHQVLDGLEAVREAGFTSIKLNCVVMRGINDDELPDFARLARETNVAVRFIEFMPLDGDGIWNRSQVFTQSEILNRIHAVYALDRTPGGDPHDPARLYRFSDGKGEIGVIASVSQPFCGSCDRTRITADGKFRTCLFSSKELDLRAPLRDRATDEEIAALIVESVRGKEQGHLINSPQFQKPARSMYAIGG